MSINTIFIILLFYNLCNYYINLTKKNSNSNINQKNSHYCNKCKTRTDEMFCHKCGWNQNKPSWLARIPESLEKLFLIDQTIQIFLLLNMMFLHPKTFLVSLSEKCTYPRLRPVVYFLYFYSILLIFFPTFKPKMSNFYVSNNSIFLGILIDFLSGLLVFTLILLAISLCQCGIHFFLYALTRKATADEIISFNIYFFPPTITIYCICEYFQAEKPNLLLGYCLILYLYSIIYFHFTKPIEFTQEEQNKIWYNKLNWLILSFPFFPINLYGIYNSSAVSLKFKKIYIILFGIMVFTIYFYCFVMTLNR